MSSGAGPDVLRRALEVRTEYRDLLSLAFDGGYTDDGPREWA
jgi:hypothetical protein